MSHAEKLEAARAKMGGSFPWQRKEWKYQPACDTCIARTIQQHTQRKS